MKILFVYLVSLTLLLRCSEAQNAELNHLQLVNVWSPTFCYRAATPCKTGITYNFYLHGLWPADSNGRTISGCPDTATGNDLRDAIQKNRAQLDKYWRSLLKGQTGDSFWMHEWTQHGPCTKLKPTKYYEIATTQQSKISQDNNNLLDALKNARIEPSNDRSYPKAEIVAAIRKINNNKFVYISCKSQNSKSYLNEIFICLDKTGSDYLPCPAAGSKTSCAANIFIPTSITLGTDDVAAI